MKNLLKITFMCALGIVMLQAKVTKKDVETIAKAISFVDGAPKGDVAVAVVVDGSKGKDTADEFIKLGKDNKLSGTVTAPGDLKSTSAKVVFIPADIDNFDAVFDAAKSKGLITLSNNDACVKAKKCAISVSTDPSVDIKTSKEACKATNVSFGAAFEMMLKQQD